MGQENIATITTQGNLRWSKDEAGALMCAFEPDINGKYFIIVDLNSAKIEGGSNDIFPTTKTQ